MAEHDDELDVTPVVRANRRPVGPEVADVLADGLAQIAAAIDEGLEAIAKALRPPSAE